MGYAVGASELVDKVRGWIADQAGEVWTDSQILARCDQALDTIKTRVRLSGQDHDLASTEVQLGALTAVAGQIHVRDWPPPEPFGAIRAIEAVLSGGVAVPIHQTALHSKEWGRMQHLPRLTWHRGPGGVVRLVGEPTGVGSLRVHYLMTWMPLHFGEAAGGSTTTLTFDPSPAGRVLRQQDGYVGHRLRFLEGANEGLTVTVTAYNRATNVVTFTPAVAAVTAGDAYEMIVPVDKDHGDYLILDVAVALVTSAGNAPYLATLAPRHAMALEQFEASLATRDQTGPRSLWYTDR